MDVPKQPKWSLGSDLAWGNRARTVLSLDVAVTDSLPSPLRCNKTIMATIREWRYQTDGALATPLSARLPPPPPLQRDPKRGLYMEHCKAPWSFALCQSEFSPVPLVRFTHKANWQSCSDRRGWWLEWCIWQFRSYGWVTAVVRAFRRRMLPYTAIRLPHVLLHGFSTTAAVGDNDGSEICPRRILRQVLTNKKGAHSCTYIVHDSFISL